MITKSLHLFLADDDEDDRMFFGNALEELPIAAHLTLAHDGEQLMKMLTEDMAALPDLLFIDLNMPRKNGFECLKEIQNHEQLMKIPVVIISTSFEQNTIDRLYKDGAQYHIRKPAEFSKLKEMILQVLTLHLANISQTANGHLALNGGSNSNPQ